MPTKGRPRVGAPMGRLTERHFPAEMPSDDQKEKPRKRCHVCCVPTGVKRRKGIAAPRRHETRFWCPDCGVPLCIVNCFKIISHCHKL